MNEQRLREGIVCGLVSGDALSIQDYASESWVCGVEWDYSDSSTSLTRIGGASANWNIAPATTLDARGFSPFDSIMPWAGMKRYNITNDGMLISENDPGFSMTANDTLVRIPKFYYKVEQDWSNNKIRWWISSGPRSGFQVHPGSNRYISRYHSVDANGIYSSLSGKTPISGKTRAAMRSNSHNKGDNWWMLDIATWSALQLLYLIEFADWNIQSKLGRGQTSGSIISTGATDSAIYHTVNRDASSNQYRWIENLYSNVRDFVDGCVNVNNRVYVGINNEMFKDAADNYVDTGISIPSTTGFIKELTISESAPWMFIPTKVGGTNSTYIPDHSIHGSGITMRVTGGSEVYNANWGIFKYDSNDSATFTAANLGSRLIYIP